MPQPQGQGLGEGSGRKRKVRGRKEEEGGKGEFLRAKRKLGINGLFKFKPGLDPIPPPLTPPLPLPF